MPRAGGFGDFGEVDFLFQKSLILERTWPRMLVKCRAELCARSSILIEYWDFRARIGQTHWADALGRQRRGCHGARRRAMVAHAQGPEHAAGLAVAELSKSAIRPGGWMMYG
jgi:hypothetical protein